MNILFTPQFEKPILEGTKIHTIRSNYDYWKRKADGKECSFRVWTGKPRRSPQREFYRGFIHVQPVTFEYKGAMITPDGYDFDEIYIPSGCDGSDYKLIYPRKNSSKNAEIALNDGFEDLYSFSEWFISQTIGYKLFAILHWTDFRY